MSAGGNFFSNSIQRDPQIEIKNTFGRYESQRFSQGSFMKGRGICLLLVPLHAIGIVAKPLIYTVGAAGSLGIAAGLTVKIAYNKLFSHKNTSRDSQLRKDLARIGLGCTINVIVSPFGQIAQVAKAAAGIVYPLAYFKRPAQIQNHNLNNNNNPINTTNNNNNNPINNEPININLNSVNNLHEDFIENNNATHQTWGSSYRVFCPINYPVENSLEGLANLAIGVDRGATSLSTTYLGQRGIDAGGLRRDYVYRLFNGVATTLRLKDSLVYQQGSNEAALRHIGMILPFLLRRINRHDSSSDYTIGDALPSTYFRGMLSLNYNEIHGNVESLSAERTLEILHTAKDPTATKLHAFLNWDGTGQDSVEGRAIVEFVRESLYSFADEDQLPAGAITNNRINVAHLQAIKDHYLTEYVDGAKEQVRALQTIAQGMNLTPASWESLQSAGAKRVQDHIQGAFDKDRVKDSLVFNGGSQAIINGIKAWVDTKSEDELRNFLAYINGSPAISNIQVNIGIYGAVLAHSCFSTIDIPQNAPIELITRILDDYCAGNSIDANFDRG